MQRFSVVSYNIHECVGNDGRRDASRIARIIKESRADVIGLQEVHSDLSGGDDEELHQMDYLAKATGLQAVAGTAFQRRNGDFGNILLTNRPILNVQKLDLSIPGREPRGALDVDLEIGGETVRVIVTHLGLRPGERRFQVKRLLLALSDARTRIVVILSDINEWLPNSRSLRWLQEHFGQTPRLRTFPSRFPVFPLDRIWVSPPSALVHLAIFNTPLTRIASDHLPLKATIQTSSEGILR
jgi:endonuclease/exonuclease/phosphatase family metal-dependent hydrolase